MRVVGRPHQVIGADYLGDFHPHRILYKRSVYLAMEILTGQLGQIEVGPVPMALVGAIHLFQEIANPSDIAFDRDEPKPRKTLQNSGEDNLGEGFVTSE